MAMMNQTIVSFNAGELSPFIGDQSGLAKYRNGCSTLENYLPSPYGPANRRQGTQYVGGTKVNATRSRLIPLNFSDTNKFQAEIGVGYIRFWTGGATPLPYTYASSGSWSLYDSVNPATLDTVSYTSGQIIEGVPVDYLGNYIGSGTPLPYQSNELDQINFTTVGNVAYLTHPNYFPIRISYYGQSNPFAYPPFTVGEVPWKWPPMTSENTSNTTIQTFSSFSVIKTYSSFISPVFTWSLNTSTGVVTVNLTGGGFNTCLGFIVTSSTQQVNACLGIFYPTSATANQLTYTIPLGNTIPAALPTGVITIYGFTGTQNTSGLTSGNTVYLLASTPIFSNNHIGAYFEIDHINPTPSINYSLGSGTVPNTNNGTSASIACFGSWTLSTWGNWTGTITLQSSLDNINWQNIRSYYSNTDNNTVKNYTDSGSADFITYYRIVLSGNSSAGASSSPYVTFSPDSAWIPGWVKITSLSGNWFSGGYSLATATVGATIGVGSATPAWWEGAFSAVQGYPSAVAVHESRVIFGGTTLLPTSVWGSAVNDFQNFLQGALDSNSYLFNLASNTGGRIQWIISQGAMAIGTTQDEWLLTSSSTANTALTPSNVSAQKQSHYGSATVPATLVNDTILYIQRAARKIREFAYNWQILKWISVDATAYAEQATRTQITERSLMRVPQATLWMTRTDGQLVSMLYEKEEQVTAFARHITNGTFESVSVLPGVNSEDEVWVIVNRTVGGSTVRYVERLALGQQDALDNATKSAWWYLDCASLISQSSSTTVTGLSYLNGQTVMVWGKNSTEDWSYFGSYTVSAGAITCQYPVTNAVIGIPYTSKLVPMRIVSELQTGSSVGQVQSINEINVRLYNSLGGQISTDGKDWQTIAPRQMDDPLDASPIPNDSWTRVITPSSFDDFADITIRHNQPTPLSIVSLAAAWEMTEQK